MTEQTGPSLQQHTHTGLHVVPELGQLSSRVESQAHGLLLAWKNASILTTATTAASSIVTHTQLIHIQILSDM